MRVRGEAPVVVMQGAEVRRCSLLTGDTIQSNQGKLLIAFQERETDEVFKSFNLSERAFGNVYVGCDFRNAAAGR